MGTGCRIWIYANIWILLSICRVDSSEDSFSHKEISIPKLISQNSTNVPYNHIVNPPRTLTLLFKWRENILRMRLEQHALFPKDAMAEWWTGGNLTEVELLMDDSVHYQGHVIGGRFGFVALDYAYGGFTGYIQLDDEGVTVEPNNQTGSAPGSHVLTSTGRTPPINNTMTSRRRRRRAAPGQFTKYLEVLLVADTSVVEFLGQDRVKQYLLTLMNIANEVYHDSTLGVRIEVVTVKIMFMDKESERSVVVSSEPQRTVDRFCHWVSAQAHRNGGTGSHHDIAVLLSRSKFGPAGYAPITGLCVPMRNCALVKDDGFTSAFVIAHEMAHIFGLMHDGHGNRCHGREFTTSIMATIVQYLHCLNNNPYTVEEGNIPQPLGKGWSLDEQCRVEFGDRAKHCPYFGMMDPCAQMWCDDGTRRYSCKTKNVVALDGTQCGTQSQYYCMAGVCGYHGEQAPIPGGWSDWSPWSECSANCNFGFKRRSRVCDDPKPDYGGADCDGESENTDLCIAEECTNYLDLRADQCATMNSAELSWRPYQLDKGDYHDQYPSDRCKLTCVADGTTNVVTFDVFVENGTPCSYDDPGEICLDGQCERVGCDGVRGSDARPDRCGVCRGDGTSCKTVSGVFKKKFQYSAAGEGHYEKVLVLPDGARDITIKETATLPHFISLQDTLYHQQVLNGDGQQGTSRNFAMEGAWFKYINNRGHEKLHTNGPIHRDINLMVHPMDWQVAAGLEYNYTVDNEDYTLERNTYTWKFEDWTPCSVSCGKGMQHIVYGCYDRTSDEKVAEEKCRFLESKDAKEYACEMVACEALNYLYRMLREYSTCSATCGTAGVRYQLYECEMLQDGTKVDDKFCKHIPEPIFNEPCNRISCTQKTFRWEVTSTWSSCSQTCGDAGTQYQLFHCVREGEEGNTGNRVSDLYCSDIKSPKETRPCHRVPCVSYKWESTNDWLKCNETCGTYGIQHRTMDCIKYLGEERKSAVADWYCSAVNKVPEGRECNRRDCFSVRWIVTDQWTSCTETCGTGGVREKVVICKNVTYDDRERALPPRFCMGKNKPLVSETCNQSPCETFRWKPTDEWTVCSKPCGELGEQERIHRCFSVLDEEDVPDENCNDLLYEVNTRVCNRFPCHTFEWRPSEKWNPPCRKSCTEKSVDAAEKQVQEFQCLQIYSEGQTEVTDAHFCEEFERPYVDRKCPVIHCDSYEWRLTEWSECNATCGVPGTEIRVAVCMVTNEDDGDQIVSSGMCQGQTKPPDQRRPCSFGSCFRYMPMEDDGDDAWSVCSMTCGVGIQLLEQRCVMDDGGNVTAAGEESCEKGGVKKTTRSCDAGPCGFLEWGAGPWSMCSRTCGRGKQIRQVYCGIPGDDTDRSRCPGKVPEEYRTCNDKDCPVENANAECTDSRKLFCSRATRRYCRHQTYLRVCCKTCTEMIGEENKARRRRRYRSRY
ncbi:ATS3-like protein [Mya arenaria]|uniref:ATS3-like protein n=1 Tax=Mya arenaria TaxID=6604 RepID=A0ABY7DGZ2_MYAAR|nr:ATS3-like protein [Mya arenaria]